LNGDEKLTSSIAGDGAVRKQEFCRFRHASDPIDSGAPASPPICVIEEERLARRVSVVGCDGEALIKPIPATFPS